MMGTKNVLAIIFVLVQGGIYILQIMDWYCASFSLMLISMTECLALSWAYGMLISLAVRLKDILWPISFIYIFDAPYFQGVFSAMCQAPCLSVPFRNHTLCHSSL